MKLTNVRTWHYFVIPMPLNKDGKGPETDINAIASMTFEVWDQEFRSHGSFAYIPDAINHAINLNKFAEQEL